MPIQTPSYNGISQDLFYGDNGECAYMENVSTDAIRYEELSLTYTLIGGGNIGVTDTITHMKETPAGVISCGNNRVFLNGGDKSATVAGATRVEYSLDSSGTQTNYFFTNASIIKTNSDISSVTTTTAKPTAGLTTATFPVRDTILYAVGSTIYEYNITTNAITTVLTTLRNGVTVKELYYYNDMLMILTTIGNDTIVYQAQFDGTDYGIYSTEIKVGLSAIVGIGDSGILYWITNNRIFGFNGGQSQEIRFSGYNENYGENLFGGNLAFKDGDLLIGYGDKIFIWGAKHAGRRNALTIKKVPQGTIQYITGQYIHIQNVTNYVYIDSSKYPDIGYTISLPYDASIYGMEKESLAIRIGYQLPSTTSIELWAQTDKMEMVDNTDWIKIADITDTTKTNQYITVNEIGTALGDTNWSYIRFKRVYNGAGGTSGLRDYSPKFFDLEFIHTYTNERLKSA